jgi:hypothetical protein
MPVEPTESVGLGILLAASGSAFLLVLCIVLVVNAKCDRMGPRFSLLGALMFTMSFGLLMLGLMFWKNAEHAWAKYDEEVSAYRLLEAQFDVYSGPGPVHRSRK